MIKSMQTIANKSFHAVWFALFSLLLLNCYPFLRRGKLIFLAAVLGCFCLIVISIKIKPYIDRLSTCAVMTTVTVLSLGCFLFACFCGRDMLCMPFNDTGNVYFGAAEVLMHGELDKIAGPHTPTLWATGLSNHDYFLTYPHNTFLVFYLLQFMRLLGCFMELDLYSEHGVYTIVVLNAASIGLSVFFGALTAGKIKGNFAALLSAVMGAAFVPYYIHAYKPYSDTLPLFWLSLALFAFFSIKQQDKKERKKERKKNFLYALLCGLSFSIAGLIKANLLIVLIAVGIFTALRCRKGRDFSHIIVIAVCVITISGLWNSYLHNNNWIDFSNAERYEFPKTHWVMMASIGSGSYIADDFHFTMSYETKEAKTEATIQEYLRRVKSYDSIGAYVTFIFNKLSGNLADCKYAQSGHLSRFGDIWNGKIISPQGELCGIPYYYTTIYTFIVYFLCLISSAHNMFSNHIRESSMLNIAFFGTIVFFAFWEFKSRYLLSFCPVMLLLACISLFELLEPHVQQAEKHPDCS